MKRRVVKVGGSLLQHSDLAAKFTKWLADQQPAEQVYVVVGGGSVVDQVRQLADRFTLSDRDAHWLAIRAMSVTAQLFADLIPQAELITELSDAAAGLFVLDAYHLLRGTSSEDPLTLPCGWHVTSDSIAAFLANAIHADELIVLKAAAYQFTSLDEAAAHQFVDSYFPRAVGTRLTVGFDML